MHDQKVNPDNSVMAAAVMENQKPPIPKEKVMKVSDMPLLDGKFVIAGTGSRSLILDEGKMNKVQEYLIDLLTEAKAKHGNNLVVISGMAEGFDEALARSAMCVGVTLIAAIPNKGYSAYYWRNNSQLKVDRMDSFQELAGYAHRSGGVHYVCGKDIYVNGKHSNFVRNEWMADRADVVWVYNPTSRGTAQCYNYCRTNGIKTFIINPEAGNVKNTDNPVEPVNPTEKENIVPVISDNPKPTVKEKTMFHGIVENDQGYQMRVFTSTPIDITNLKVIEEFKMGSYVFAFLDTFFAGQYYVEVRELAPNFIKSEIAAPPLEIEEDITGDLTIRWSTAQFQFNVKIDGDEGWLGAFNRIGLKITNSKKMSKRLQEIVRQTPAWMLTNRLDIEVMDPAEMGIDEKVVDGISAISMTMAEHMVSNNTAASSEWKEKMINGIKSGKTTIVSLRILSPYGLIKGNAIILKDSMMNGYDVRTFTPNIKPEMSTTDWYWATIEPSYGKLPLKSDDLTLAIYNNVSGIIDPWLLLATMQSAMDDLVKKMKDGSEAEWKRDIVEHIGGTEHQESDVDKNKPSMIKSVDKLQDTLAELGLTIHASQLLMYLKASGVARMVGLVDGNNRRVQDKQSYRQNTGTWMPIPYAYRAHIMTREVLEIFGFRFKQKNNEGFYHNRTHCFVVPAEFFIENYANHGGYDLDDTINVMIRDFVDANGNHTMKAFLLRNPNDFGEWSVIPVAESEVRHCYHMYAQMPSVSEVELNIKVPQLSEMVKSGEIKYQYDVLPGASTLQISPVFNLEDEQRMRSSVHAMAGGTGATVLPKMLTYAVTGKYLKNQLVSNEQIIDAVQQGLGTSDDMRLIKSYNELVFKSIKNWVVRTDNKIDAYWGNTRIPGPVAKKYGFWVVDNYGNLVYSAIKPSDESSMLTEFFWVREYIVRKACEELMEWANTAVRIPDAVSRMQLTDEEKLKAPAEFRAICDMHAVSESSAAWSAQLVKMLKKSDELYGEEVTDRKMLRLYRQSFIAKRAKPKANWDKWLFVVDPAATEIPFHWFTRAYKRLIASE
jgi:hypothetical protein